MRTTRRQQESRARWSRILGGCALLAGSVIGASFSCTSTPPAAVPASPQPDTPQPNVQPAAQESATATARSNYAEAIRRREFQRAALLLDQATDDDKNAPELRYARALVALELNDLDTALRQVDGLEKEWPVFEPEAQQVRIEVAKRSRDVSLLSAFLPPVDNVANKLLLAEAHMHSSSAVEARKLAESALSQLSKAKGKTAESQQVHAHALKARSLVAQGEAKLAAQEFRWLAVQAATIPPQSLSLDSSYDEQMSTLDPNLSLSAQERRKRAEEFSEKGWVEATERELQTLVAQKNPAPTADALLAWAIYVSRTDYERAAQLFAQAAKSDPSNRKKHLYYEAKALARSNRDTDAIAKYEHVAQLGGQYADHSAFQAARLRFIDGQWKPAVTALSLYLKRFGKGALHKDDAEYTRAVARLAAADYVEATKELSELLKRERSMRVRARLMELIGVGLLKSGGTAAAAKMFREVIDYRPLSLPAALASARLAEMGEVVPPSIIPPPESPASTDQATPAPPLTLALPEKVWRLNRVGLDAPAEEALRDAEPALRIKYGARRGEALCQLYGQLQSAQRRFQIAQTAASWSNLKFAPNADTRWEWECIYPQPYDELVAAETRARSIPEALVYGIMRQESAFRPEVVSPAHAVGLMQIIPPTAKRIAEEIDVAFDADLMRSPATNIRFGSYYLRRLLDMFGGRIELVAAAYNAGPHALSRWLRKGDTLPLDIFVARIPYDETRDYVYKVVGNYLRYAYLRDPSQPLTVSLELPQGLSAPEDAY